MSQQSPSSEAQAPTQVSEPTAPAPESGRVYTAAEQRAAILERAGARDLGAFHPHAPREQPAAEPEQSAQPAPEAPTPPVPAPVTPDVTNELAQMRAELAALQARAQEPEPEDEPVAPAAAAHPLEAHARNVLGPGAQPHHVQRAIGLLEQDMQWRAYLAHHESNPSDAGPAEQARAKREIDRIAREVQDLGELASLHAQVSELKAAREQVTPEQRKQARSQWLDGVLVDAQAMAHHPNLARAMASDPTLRDSVKEYLLTLPENEAEFVRLGNSYLHSLDALVAKSAPAPALAAPAQQQPAQHATTATGARPSQAAAPMPRQSERYPVRPIAPGTDQQPVSKRAFWDRIHEGMSARVGA